MQVKAINNSNSTHEFHAVDCVHQKNMIGNFQETVEFDASNKKELMHQIEVWFNVDFAKDNQMSVEEYVASGDGYKCSTKSGSDLQLFPCVKF